VCVCAWAREPADRVFSEEVGGNETQFTLRELQPNRAYRLRMAAGTGAGFGVASEWAHQQTLAHYNHSMGEKSATSWPLGGVGGVVGGDIFHAARGGSKCF